MIARPIINRAADAAAYSREAARIAAAIADILNLVNGITPLYSFPLTASDRAAADATLAALIANPLVTASEDRETFTVTGTLSVYTVRYELFYSKKIAVPRKKGKR